MRLTSNSLFNRHRRGLDEQGVHQPPAQDNREVFKIVFGHGAAYNDVIQHAQALFAADVEETVREGIASGVFTPLPPDIVAQAMVGMATQALSWWATHESVAIETLDATMTTLTLHGLEAAAPGEGDR